MTRDVLLDTHTFLWYAVSPDTLSRVAYGAVVDAAQAYVSAATVWEVRTKHRLGKLPMAAALVAAGLPSVIARLNLQPLSVDPEDGDMAGALPGRHRDPFDRMLAAQARRRNLVLVSNDAALDAFGVTRVW